MWYTNPVWYALVISILSFAISLLSFLKSRRTVKLSIEQRLAQHATQINESLLRHNVKGPYAHKLSIPKSRTKEFSVKAILLLYHINLLYDVFKNQDILGKRIVAAYSSWATNIVQPWIKADEDLQKTWEIFKDNKDFYGEEYICWMGAICPDLKCDDSSQDSPTTPNNSLDRSAN